MSRSSPNETSAPQIKAETIVRQVSHREILFLHLNNVHSHFHFGEYFDYLNGKDPFSLGVFQFILIIFSCLASVCQSFTKVLEK